MKIDNLTEHDKSVGAGVGQVCFIYKIDINLILDLNKCYGQVEKRQKATKSLNKCDNMSFKIIGAIFEIKILL